MNRKERNTERDYFNVTSQKALAALQEVWFGSFSVQWRHISHLSREQWSTFSFAYPCTTCRSTSQYSGRGGGREKYWLFRFCTSRRRHTARDWENETVCSWKRGRWARSQIKPPQESMVLNYPLILSGLGCIPSTYQHIYCRPHIVSPPPSKDVSSQHKDDNFGLW